MNDVSRSRKNGKICSKQNPTDNVKQEKQKRNIYIYIYWLYLINQYKFIILIFVLVFFKHRIKNLLGVIFLEIIFLWITFPNNIDFHPAKHVHTDHTISNFLSVVYPFYVNCRYCTRTWIYPVCCELATACSHELKKILNLYVNT